MRPSKDGPQVSAILAFPAAANQNGLADDAASAKQCYIAVTCKAERRSAMNKIANIAPHKRQRGRPLGSCNKVSALLKDAILMAGDEADPEGLVGYLTKQALTNPVAFMGLLGKVLPLQLAGGGDGPIEIRWLPPLEPPPE